MKTNQAQKEAMEQPKPTDGFSDIEWSVVEGGNTEFAVQYPRMQWIHGSKQLQGFMKAGGFFLAADQYPNFAGEGFSKTILVTREGDEIPGYAASTAKLAVIRVKHQWVKSEEGRNVPLCHALVAVKGCDDLVCLSLKGPTKALEFQKAFNQHISQNVALANRTRPAGAPGLEPFALWFEVRAGDYFKAEAKSGKDSSSVTPPELVVPEKFDRDHVVTLWVGGENYKQFAAFWRDTKVWQNQPIWEQRQESAAAHDSDAPQFTGGSLDDDAPVASTLLRHLINLCLAKDFSEEEVMAKCTDGRRSKFEELTNAEARLVIEGVKAS